MVFITKNSAENKFLDFFDKYYYLFLAIVLFMALFNIFYNLGHVPINSWDEARHGASAFEMLKTGNPIVNTYAYEIDYWNLKPPLSFWLIGLGYKIAGFNPVGLRIFSAAAAFITIAVTAYFTFYHFGKLASLISTSVLATTTQYILSHCARTGDADSIHVLFFTLAVVLASFSSKNIKWFYLSGLSFSLAFLNKSWHALSIPAIIGLYLLVNKMFLKIRKKNG
jgi:4-amino-4-deoxy-L-arabinose transferase-like glycosyltransferase